MKAKHAEYIHSIAKKENPLLDHLLVNGIYWSITALDILDDPNINDLKIFDKVVSLQGKDGGFSPALNHDTHILSTLSAVQILITFDQIHRIDIDATCTCT